MLPRKFISIDSFSIAYTEKNVDSEKIIFFFHGNSNSADLWVNQLSNPDFDAYHLIAFDLPAHGDSEIPNNPLDCNIIYFAETLSKAILKLAGENSYILCGLSLGGNIIAEMLNFSINPAGLIFVSTNLVGNGITPVDINSEPMVGEVLFSDRAPLELIEAYLAKTSESKKAEHKNTLFRDYKSVKPSFRKDFPGSIVNGTYSDEVSLVSAFNNPVMIVFGKSDVISPINLMNNQFETLWGDQIFIIEDSGHIIPFDQPDILNKLMLDFLTDLP